jgi:hypothetical protein
MIRPMIRPMTRLLTTARRGAFALLLPCLALATPAAADAPLRESFDLRVPVAPAAVPVDGQHLLRYELHLANFAAQPLAPTRIEVRDADSGAVIARLEGPALSRSLALPGAGASGADPSSADARTIAQGMHGVAYLEVTLPAQAQVPAALDHHVEYRVDDRSGARAAVDGAHVRVDRRPLPVLGPPLRGGPWVAIHSPAWARGHRRVLYAVDGRARIPGRFAIDWVRVDAQGRTTHGDPDRVDSFLGHGADVLAVADAVVSAVRDDMPESETISAHPHNALADASGNYIALDLGHGRHAFYEHLEPGSIRVAPGQRVRRGQVIAALGFTGDSTGPHLHFHVADGPSPLGAEGIAFVIDRFDVPGRYADIGTLGTAPWQPRADNLPRRRAMEWPAPNVVVEFDAK